MNKFITFILMLTTLIIIASLLFLAYKYSDLSNKLNTLLSSQSSLSSSNSYSISYSLSNISISTSNKSSVVTIYFSKDPLSMSDPTIVGKVERITNRTDKATFSIEQLILGPTSIESSSSLFTPIKVSGGSNCSGSDFSLSISSQTATFKFCKVVESAGILSDARITNTISKTLLQFPTINKVIIIDKSGNCFGDMSGLNTCLN